MQAEPVQPPTDVPPATPATPDAQVSAVPITPSIVIDDVDAAPAPTLTLAEAELAPSPPSSPSAPIATTDAHTFEGSARSSDGATAPWLLLPPERAYRMYVPSHRGSDDPMPLVVMIHGCRETAADFERGTRMNASADRGGFAVLYPEQAAFANLRRCWNWFEPNTAAGYGECAIILEMIKAAHQHVALDLARVYVAGMSSGGALAALLAFHHPHVFAAVAVHSGLPPMMPPSAAAAISAMERGVRVDPEALADSYWNTHELPPPPLIIVHGDADPTVTEKNATRLMQVWEKLVESAPQATPLTRDARDFASTESARAYSQIDLQREGRIIIRSMRVHGLAHRWSGGDAALPFNDAQGPDATAAIWKFFERQQR